MLDASVIDSYNSTNKVDYELLPSSAMEMSYVNNTATQTGTSFKVLIRKGEQVSEGKLAFNIKALKDAQGNKRVIENNILRPFNDALRRLPGGATINPLSSSLTWQVSANIDDNNQITELVMSKVPYHSFAFDGDKRLINFTNNLANIYEK